MTKGLSKKIQGDEEGDPANPADGEEKSEKDKKMRENLEHRARLSAILEEFHLELTRNRETSNSDDW